MEQTPFPAGGGPGTGSPAPSTGPAPDPARRRGARGRHRDIGSGRGRAIAAAVLAVVAVLGVVGGVRLLGREPAVTVADLGALPTTAAATTPPARTPPAARTPARTAVPRTPAPTRRAVSPAPPAPPSGFALPAQRVTAPVVPMGVRPDGELEVPESPRTVGWWVGSAPAGSPKGSTVLAGHVDSVQEGLGAFAALRDVVVGGRVVLTDSFRGRHTYRVLARRTHPKYALPREVFRGAPLVLITCGGPFDEDTGRYRDNIVVFAELVS